MLEPIQESKQEFIDKFYNWYLKDLALDLATKASDFLINHTGKAHEISWSIGLVPTDTPFEYEKVMTIVAIYHFDVNGTEIKTRYECGIDLPE